MRRIFLLFFLTLSPLVTGSVYYLSPQGDDASGNGSITYPWFTLERAWKAVTPGDTIILRGGTYEYGSRQDLTSKDGTPGKPINIWGFSGEKPVITKTQYFDMNLQTNLIYIDADYLYIKDLEISYFEQKPDTRASSALFCFTSNSKFETINYHHNALGMIIRGNSSNNLILNCDFHHNYDPYDETPYRHSDGLDIAEIPSGTVNTVKGCRFFKNADDGLDLWNNDGIVVIDSCWAWMNGYMEDGISIGGDGAGFKLGKTTMPDYDTYNRVLTNNVSVSNRTFGITQNAALCKMFICNNIVYDNKHMGIYFSAAWGDAEHMIRNNIAYKNASDAVIGIKQPIIVHNSWQNGLIVSDADFLSLDGSQLSMSRKADGNLPDITFMHLAPGSDLIDAGADAGLPFQGMAPDIGAFENPTSEVHTNQSPVVSISSPVKGISFTTPATVIIDIEANDPDGNITKVELFNGNNKLGERTAAPYSFTLKDLSEGSYSLKAIATDNLKATTTSPFLDLEVKSSSNETREFFTLYPNPNDGRFSINFTTTLEVENYIVTIVDLIGKTVYQQELSNDETIKQFDLSQLKSGIYVLMISSNQILLTQKFIKG